MGKKSLSDLGIRRMKAGSSANDINEYRGLIVNKTKNNKISFFYRYEELITKKGVKMKLGDYPNMTLAMARSEVERLKNLRKQGISPRQSKKDDAIREKEEMLRSNISSSTMKDLVDYYLTEYISDKKINGVIQPGARQVKGQNEVRSILYSSIVKEIGSVSVSDITVADIVKVIEKMINRGVNVQAGNTVRELNSAFEYALGREYLQDDFINPMIAVKRKFKFSKHRLVAKKGTRFFTDKELEKFLQWLPESDFLDNAKNIFMLTLYSGCRTGEWCNAKWSDINFEKNTFHISLAKNGASRDVQLSTQAVELLKKIKEKSQSQYLFVSSKTGEPLKQKKLTEYTYVLRTRNKMIDLPSWSPHDLRRTVRTGLARLQCPREVAEAVLGHSAKGIEGTYNLHGYDKECRIWLQKWCDHLDKL